jgi:IS5 family transposase
VECIGKGKARTPYEFGCKVSVGTPVTRPKGGQFVLHAKALHGNPFDGHTLDTAITDIEKNTGIEVKRTHVDKGYRGHNPPNKFRVWITGHVRRTTATIKREMKRRAAVEPIIGPLKAEHRMGRNYLKEATETASTPSPPPSASTSTLIRWFAALLRAFFQLLIARIPIPQSI